MSSSFEKGHRCIHQRFSNFCRFPRSRHSATFTKRFSMFRSLFYLQKRGFFEFTKCCGHCSLSRVRQPFNSYFPFCVINGFHQLLLVHIQLCFQFSRTFKFLFHFLVLRSNHFQIKHRFSKSLQSFTVN